MHQPPGGDGGGGGGPGRGGGGGGGPGGRGRAPQPAPTSASGQDMRATGLPPLPPCSALMAAHRTAVLRHDALGAETLLNLLMRNYLAYKLYDQVRRARTRARQAPHRLQQRARCPGGGGGSTSCRA